MTRKALGRGLGALLSAETQLADENPLSVQIDLIKPNPVQPRIQFDDVKLRELAESISANGLVQPILVRKRDAAYELIAGERRLRAARIAGLSEVPVVVRDVADDKLLELALIENIQREDLNPIEEANAYKNLIETIGLTQEVLATRVGRDRSYITNYLRLLRLPEDLQQLVRDGKLSTGHARTLLAVTDLEAQRKLARKIIEANLSVRDVEKLVKEKPGRAAARKIETQDANVKAAEAKLRRRFGTKVRIIQNGKSRDGRIEITFFDDQDLNRLYDLLLNPQPVAIGSTS